MLIDMVLPALTTPQRQAGERQRILDAQRMRVNLLNKALSL